MEVSLPSQEYNMTPVFHSFDVFEQFILNFDIGVSVSVLCYPWSLAFLGLQSFCDFSVFYGNQMF